MSTGMQLWNGASGDERLVRIQTALREALDDESFNLEIRGSQVKGTHTNLSDLDVIIRTPGRCVSRADKLAVVAKLRKNPMFHKSHVNLKRLSIFCVVDRTDIDLVFESTRSTVSYQADSVKDSSII